MTGDAARTEVETTLADLLDRYSHDPTGALADLIDLATAGSRSISGPLSATTQREQVLEVASRFEAAAPAESGPLLRVVENQLAGFSAANALALVTVLDGRPPDPRIGALALRLVSEAGAVRELSARVAEALGLVFCRHAHPGLASAFAASEARLAGVRPHVYGHFFTDAARAAVRDRGDAVGTEPDLAAVRTALMARVRSETVVGRDELVRAVCDWPDDDAPRAIYADWLLEQGSPLGEFITLQLRRARGRLPKGLASTEKALLVSHRAEWLGELAGAVALRSVGFERGFLAHAALVGVPPATPMLKLLRSMECNLTQLTAVVARNQTGWLRELTLQAREGLDAATVVLARGRFSKLHTLTLVSVIAHVNDVLPAVFGVKELQAVTTLRFERGVIGTPSAAVLAGAPAGTERIELVDSGRTWTRGEPEWPDSRAEPSTATAEG
jgi:uncharacterized protein (TIGR02996 family)